MVKVLFLNPSRWGRGITPIWVASHSAVLRSRGHEVALFDATFFRDFAHNENAYNTANRQYKPSAYDASIQWNDAPVVQALQAKIDAFKPDYIFFAAISSHIHGEGEYAAIQHGHGLLRQVQSAATIVSGGLQPTADAVETADRFPLINMFIGGESELVLGELVTAGSPRGIKGMIWRDGERVIVEPKQPIISQMDAIGAYDYSLFDEQVFLRPYNGQVVKAVDYELSRGCPFTCGYCVETVIQRYYGFTETSPRGALTQMKSYLRHKSAGRVFEELNTLNREHGVTLIRAQDTNFLTIDRSTLLGLADRFDAAGDALSLQFYIETRPEGINPSSLTLLKRLRVDGVGMGIELAGQQFRESSLNRFADQKAILRAFALLKEAGIRRTAYNIIGLPDQNEESILDTIRFNQELAPDNVTVAFYSPYLGTAQQRVGADKQYFLDYEFDLDSQLRSMSRHAVLSEQLLSFYKRNFVRLVQDGLGDLNALKEAEGLATAPAMVRG